MKPQPANRLIREKSPYLLQHARNPVDWFPWGDEAFEKARREQKPIFLSVGYSTCHWCHVMERESFENPEIAALLNRHFVPVKVDREERPDVDRVYMSFLQATTGGGGWPMSVWLTPDLRAFYGGTYFPPDDRQGRIGFGSILHRVADAWSRDPGEILKIGEGLLERLRLDGCPGAPRETGDNARAPNAAVTQFQSAFDPKAGGFGEAPKFPTPTIPRFLLRYAALNADRPAATAARDMALHTLRRMARGGIRDALGGGFHRYSVDAEWHVPHFEKMLYDQAQITCVLLDAFQCTRDPFFAGVARDTLDYVLRDLTGNEGQFFSGEDADSLDAEGRLKEGAFYTWSHREISTVLGPSDDGIFGYAFGVEPHGNAKADPHGEFRGLNILSEAHSVPQTATRFGLEERETRDRLTDACRRLLAVRAERPRPRRDDKAITAWNGLMISALARGGWILGEARYRNAARRSAEFLRARLFDPDRAMLLRRSCDGESAIEGFSDDYAFLIQGLLDLYESSADGSLLEWAITLQVRQTDLFWDPRGAGYFSTTGRDPSILLRWKEEFDGAEPSPNGVAAMNLLRLAEITGRTEFRDKGLGILSAFGERLARMPHTMPGLLSALAFEQASPLRIVLSGPFDSPEAAALLEELHKWFLPSMTLQYEAAGGGQTEWVTLQICRGTVCHAPVSSPKDLARLLGTLSPSTR
jgi:hypothetical protein